MLVRLQRVKGGIALVRSEKTALRTRSRLGDPLQANGALGLAGRRDAAHPLAKP